MSRTTRVMLGLAAIGVLAFLWYIYPFSVRIVESRGTRIPPGWARPGDVPECGTIWDWTSMKSLERQLGFALDPPADVTFPMFFSFEYPLERAESHRCHWGHRMLFGVLSKEPTPGVLWIHTYQAEHGIKVVFDL